MKAATLIDREYLSANLYETLGHVQIALGDISMGLENLECSYKKSLEYDVHCLWVYFTR